MCDSHQALDIPGPLLHSQNSPFPGRFMPQLETETRGQKRFLRKAQKPAHQLSLCPDSQDLGCPYPSLAPLRQVPVHESGWGGGKSNPWSDSIHLQLKPREGQGLSWGHTASWQQNQKLHPPGLIQPHLEPVKTLSQLYAAQYELPVLRKERNPDSRSHPCVPAPGEPAASSGRARFDGALAIQASC